MAKKDFLVDIDLNRNQLLNAVLQNLATAPSTVGLPEGFTYWNTADKTAYTYTGLAAPDAWIDLGHLYEHPSFPGTAQPTAATTGANIISQIQLTNGHVTGVTTRALTAANIGAAPSSHTHAFGQIIGLPANTILANNTGSTAVAKAVTVGELLEMLGIAYGDAATLTTGTDTNQRTWTAKQIADYVGARLNGYLTAVNLAYTASATQGVVTNSAGNNATIPAATTTNAGLMLPAEKTKLSGIAAGANNYVHPTDNPGAHPFATALTSGLQVLSQMIVNPQGHVTTIAARSLTAADIASVMINDAVNNGTNTTWSSTKIFDEIQNVVAGAATGALVYKGNYNPATNTPAITTNTDVKTGWTYVIDTAGTFAGQAVEAGDMIIAKVDNPGATAANWQIVNKNIPAIVDATTAVKGIIQLATSAEATAGTNATKAITPATLKAVLDASVGGYAANFGNGSNTAFTITHGLNTQDVTIQVQRVSDRAVIEMETKAASNTTVTIGCNVAPATNAYRVIIKK